MATNGNSPFDYIKSLINTKKSLYDTEELFDKEYVPFIINRGLANDASYCLFANEMNKYASVDKKLQHDFYFYGIPKTGKFIRWVKKEKEKDDVLDVINIICDVYECNIARAYEIINILTDEQITILKSQYGGKQNGKSSRSKGNS